MSGLEVLGAVSSGFAVADMAGQVASGLLKLKKLWDEVHDAPNTIAGLIRKLEIMQPVVMVIEEEFADTVSMPRKHDATILSLSYCRQAIDSLDHLVTDLKAEIESPKKLKRGRAKAKVVLGKELLAKCEKRLEDALQILSLAYQCYQG
jgi:hypothetical protein